jgi:drug/metabolite transporter (DMT)-like permease
MDIPWYAYAGFAALATGVLGVLEKRVLKHEHALAFSATLAIVNVAILIPFAWGVDFSGIAPSTFIALYAISIIASLAFFFVMRAVRHLEVSTVSPLLALGPGVSTFLAFIFLGEALSFTNIVGIALLVAGAVVLEVSVRERSSRSAVPLWKSPYVHLIFYALVLYGFSSVVDRFLLGYRGVDPLAYLFIVHLFLAFNFLVALTARGNGLDDVRRVMLDARWFIVAIALLTLASRFSQILAVSVAPLGLVVAVKHASVFVATALGGELFHERHLGRKMLACIIIFGGILLVVF